MLPALLFLLKNSLFDDDGRAGNVVGFADRTELVRHQCCRVVDLVWLRLAVFVNQHVVAGKGNNFEVSANQVTQLLQQVAIAGQKLDFADRAIGG